MQRIVTRDERERKANVMTIQKGQFFCLSSQTTRVNEFRRVATASPNFVSAPKGLPNAKDYFSVAPVGTSFPFPLFLEPVLQQCCGQQMNAVFTLELEEGNESLQEI